MRIANMTGHLHNFDVAAGRLVRGRILNSWVCKHIDSGRGGIKGAGKQWKSFHWEGSSQAKIRRNTETHMLIVDGDTVPTTCR